jgi:hypothetical protein
MKFNGATRLHNVADIPLDIRIDSSHEIDV